MRQYTQTSLWEHQKDALVRLNDQSRTLIGWQMGTGKTLFAIERDLQIRIADKRHTRTLVVAPLSTLDQWAKAFKLEFPQLKVVILNPKKRNEFLRTPGHVYIMHWQALRLMPELKGVFTHGIFDEAHFIKNRKAKVTKATKRLRIPYLTDLTGSPATDRPTDIFSILNHLKPREWSSYTRFLTYYVETEPIYVDGEKVGVKPGGPTLRWFEEGLPSIQPYYDRRLITDCLDLPEIVYTTHEVELGADQRRAYDEMDKNMIAWLEDEVGDLTPMVAPALIAKLTRLQMFALASMKLREIDEEGKHYYDMVGPSPKIDRAIDIIKQGDGEQFVVFTQFKGAVKLLSHALDKARISNHAITGDVKYADRDRFKHSFAAGNTQVFVSTIKTSGTGVDTLQTNCNQMIFLDRDWSPMVNDQAEGRLWRGRQTRAVHVQDLVAKDTVDFERRATIELKKEWVLQTLGDRVHRRKH